MRTRAPIKKGAEFFGDTETRQFFNGLDSYSLLYHSGPRPEPKIDTVIYNVDYNRSTFVHYSQIGFLARGSTEILYDPTSTDLITRDVYFDPQSKIDTFSFIDRVFFNNGLYTFSLADPAFAIQGLYEYLGRDVPDSSGLQFWLNSYDEVGVSLVELASEFIHIKSETAKSGSLNADPESNRDFVLFLYQTILEWSGNEEGVDFWTSNLDAGLATRAEVLAEFIDLNGEVTWFNAVTGQTQPFGGPSWIELA